MRARSEDEFQLESQSVPQRRGRRADDVLAMQRAARGGGCDSLLRWLAVRTGAEVLLVDPDGADAPDAPEHIPTAALARQAADELRARGLDSLVLDIDSRTVVIVSLGADTDAPVLAAVTPRPMPDGLPALLADASSVLDLCWRLECAEGWRRRLERAEARIREAVLHLLMNGHVSAARQIADLLEPPLPDLTRFHVVESPPQRRDEVARRCSALAPRAWVVPCPVYDDHVLVLAPADPAVQPSSAVDSRLASTLAAALPDCLVGVSDSVALRDTAVGYDQAFRALVTARGRADRWASFAHRPDPVLLIGPDLRRWARQLLTPLRTHQAGRPQDPDSAELSVTAGSWLAFSAQAAALLKVHRNTVSARLRQVETLLGLDLDRLPDQALLALALKAEPLKAEPLKAQPLKAEPLKAEPLRAEMTGPPGDSGPSAPLDSLLTRPAVLDWARDLLRPVDESGLGETVDAWLRHDARLAPTAAALSVSTTAVRKRLTRVEQLLERPLLRPPSDRYELWLARRAVRLAGAEPGGLA